MQKTLAEQPWLAGDMFSLAYAIDPFAAPGADHIGVRR
jgi:hypothetical protein